MFPTSGRGAGPAGSGRPWMPEDCVEVRTVESPRVCGHLVLAAHRAVEGTGIVCVELKLTRILSAARRMIFRRSRRLCGRLLVGAELQVHALLLRRARVRHPQMRPGRARDGGAGRSPRHHAPLPRRLLAGMYLDTQSGAPPSLERTPAERRTLPPDSIPTKATPRSARPVPARRKSSSRGRGDHRPEGARNDHDELDLDTAPLQLPCPLPPATEGGSSRPGSSGNIAGETMISA